MKKICLLILGCTFLSDTWAGALSWDDQADRLHLALTGALPTPAERSQISQRLEQGEYRQVAQELVNDENSLFYNNVLMNMFNVMFDREKNPLGGPGDASLAAAVAVREESSTAPWYRIFYDNLITVPKGILIDNNNPRLGSSVPLLVRQAVDRVRATNDHVYLTWQQDGVTRYGIVALQNRTKNDFIEDVIEQQVPINNPELLEFNSQQVWALRQVVGAAGIYSTRQFGMAAYEAGTNRRAVQITFDNFLCKPMETVHTTSTPSIRIARDVDRAPGGVTSTFLNRCQGCHAGMDGLRGAFAYYNYENGAVDYNYGEVQEKFNRNASVFPNGFVTQSDSWVNLWTTGPNGSLGWSGADRGNGAAAFGEMITRSEQFHRCMAQWVFQTACFVKEVPPEARPIIERMARRHQQNGSLKEIFTETALTCLDPGVSP